MTKIVIGRQLALLISIIILTTSAIANPVVQNISSGNISIQQNQNSTVVNQTSQKGIINWRSFNINGNESTHFQQPNGGVTLNRIDATQGVSQIYGRLTATGKIILINPAGIYFGPSAYVNVGGLIATTADIRDDDFLNGNYNFSKPSPYSGAIVNDGYIVARDNGLVALVGPGVINNGHIEANLGKVVLGSGETFTMNFSGDNLINFSIDTPTSRRAIDKDGNEVRDGVRNVGSLIANGGKVQISAKAARGVLDNVINLGGVAQAKSVGVINGEIILSGDKNGGVVRVSGKMIATGKGVNQKGGNIVITGNTIEVQNHSEIDVSGDKGGGNINIGGSYQGKGPLPNAVLTKIQPDVKIMADAITNGAGGNIIVWGDSAQILGEFSARGGSLSGNGGFVETSGHYLDISGIKKVDLTAAHGQTGTWLLDPTDVNITSTSPTTGGSFAANTFTPNVSGSGVSNLYAGDLATQLNTANILVITTNASGTGNGDITFNDPSNVLQNNWLTASTNTLTLQADRNITFTSALTLNGTGKTLTLNAGQTDTTGSIALNGTMDGSFTLNLNAGSAGTTTIAAALGGTTALTAITVNARPTNINANVTTQAGAGGTQTYNGDVTLGAGSVTLTGNAINLPAVSLGANTLTTSTGGATSITGVISGTGGIAFTGAGSITLGNASNSYSGGTNITGTLNVGSLPSAAGNSTIGTGDLTLGGSGSAIGLLNYTGGAVSFNRTITIGGTGGGTVINAGSGLLTLAGNGTFAIDNGTATVNPLTLSTGTNGITVSGLIRNTAGTLNLTKNGAGTLTLSAANTYSGSTTIDAGSLTLGIATGIPSTSDVSLANVASAVLNVNGFSITIGSIAGGGATGGNVTGALGNFTVGGSNASTTYAGLLTAGSYSLVKTGTGTLTLTNASNSYFSGTFILNGAISIPSLGDGGFVSPLGTLGQSTILGSSGNTGTLIYTGGATTFNRNFIVSNGGTGVFQNAGTGLITMTNGSFAFNSNTANTNNLIIDTGSFGMTLNGPITNSAGTLNLTKLGSGTLTLNSATSSYSGTTTINAGTVVASTTGSLGSGAISLASGATLSLGFSNGTLGNTNTLSLAGTGVGGLGALQATGTNVTLSNPITLTGSTTIGGSGSFAALGTITGSAGSDLTFNFPTAGVGIQLPAITLGTSGDLSVTTNAGAISQNGALIIPGTSAFNAGANTITLTNASNNLAGPITLQNTGLNDASLTNTVATILAASSLGRSLTINSSGAISQTGSLTYGNTLTLNAVGGITLPNVIGSNVALNVSNTTSGNITISVLGSLVNLTGMSQTADANFSLVNPAGNIFITTPVSVPALGSGNITFGTGGATNSIDIFSNITGSATGYVALNSIHRATQNAGVIVAPGGLRAMGGSGPLGVITLNGNNNVSSFAAITSGGGSISLNNGTNPLTIGTVNGLSGLTSNGGNISLTSGTLNITQGVNSGVGSLTVSANGSITQSATGALVIGGTTSLTLSAATSDVLLATAANNFTGAITYGGTLANIRDVGLRNINAAATLPTNITSLPNIRNLTLIFNNSSMALPAFTLQSGGSLSATAGGAMTQSGALSVPGTSSFTTGNFAITLNLANNFIGAVSLNNTGANNVSLTNATALVLGTSSVGSGALSLTANTGANSSITQLGALTQAAGASTATFNSNAAILLTNVANDFTGPVLLNSTGGTVSVTDANNLILGNASALINYQAIANGGITQAGGTALSVTGTTTMTTAGSIDLSNGGNAFTGMVTLTANGASSDATLTNSIGLITGKITVGRNVTLTTTAGNIFLSDAIDPVNVTINSAGNITQASAGIITASNLLTTTSVGGTTLDGVNFASNINLSNSGAGNIVFNNQATSLGIQGITNSAGATTIRNVGGIAITGAVTGLGAIVVAATGALNLAANISSNAAGDAIQLATNTAFTYTSGSLSTPSGQWLVWSVNPALDTNVSSLPFNFIQYSSFFNFTTPSASTPRTQAGDGLLYQISDPSPPPTPPVPPVPPPAPPSDVAPILQVPITGAPSSGSDGGNNGLDDTIQKIWNEFDTRTIKINPYCSSM